MSEQDQAINPIEAVKTKISSILGSWKFKLSAIGVIAISLIFIFFFWQHFLAVWEMNTWASRTGATPVECMLKDSNDDGYVSCTALKGESVIPLQCGASFLNIGCRVVYGTSPEVVSSVKH